MRVIAGSASRILLKTPKGLDTRPTTDRIKETLFNIINNKIHNTNFLDLFAGSGAIGIEALSRGSKIAVFVENNKNAVDCIKDNLLATNLTSNAKVINTFAKKAISLLGSENIIFDFVFIDPPFNKSLEKDILQSLIKSKIINKDSIIIIESSIDTDFTYIDNMGYVKYREKIYGSCKHSFIKIQDEVINWR